MVMQKMICTKNIAKKTKTILNSGKIHYFKLISIYPSINKHMSKHRNVFSNNMLNGIPQNIIFTDESSVRARRGIWRKRGIFSRLIFLKRTLYQSQNEVGLDQAVSERVWLGLIATSTLYNVIYSKVRCISAIKENCVQTF